MNRLDTATLPLAGLQLIEASAGTGKTHAITTLYLRLLLETPRAVRDLLVVTFTRAATDELRGRIRRRLVEAQALLSSPERIADVQDGSLREVLQQQVDTGSADAAVRKLVASVAGIDEAAIHTIHAFCQQVLGDHAFESGELFDAELTDNPQDIIDAALVDWWRQRFYPDAALAAFAASREHLATPDAVGKWLRDVLAKDLDVRIPAADIGALASLAGQLKTMWTQERESLLSRIRENKALSTDKKKGLSAGRLVQATAALDRWSQDPHAIALDNDARVLTQSTLNAMLKPSMTSKASAPASPLFAGLDDLFSQLDALELNLLAEARAEVRRRSDEQKRRANLLAFDDLIERLRTALLADGGETLAARIAEQFPAAMIDEFQDTDPAQYDIFSRIYHGRAGACLLMIGDPKQAIYSFRGADIFAYVRARQATPAAQRHTMDTNWRSAQSLVAGVNALFHRLPDIFLMGDSVPWVDVKAAGSADAAPLRIHGSTPVPLQLRIPGNDERFNKDDFRKHAATSAANEIAGLLNAAAAGEARLGDAPLQPRDIAVLVRSHAEATRMQDALRDRGIGSALASPHSVFDTTEARDLACVLDTLLAPADERALLRSLVTPLWGYTAHALTQLLADDSRRDDLQEKLHDWHRLWATRGFMPAFRRWLHAAQVPANLLARPRGERALTNLLQLAELLQQASRDHASPDELRQWLARGIAGDSLLPGEARQLRLESDENLVQVVTMHKSKGLEYPVVFLPFAGLGALHGDVPGREDKPVYHDEKQDYRLVLDYLDVDAAMPRAKRESLAEDMRLLYVALTRAQHLCCVHWGAAPGFSALALLLLGEKDEPLATTIERHRQLCKAGTNAQVANAVRSVAAGNPGAIAVLEPEENFTRYSDKPAATETWQAAPVTRTLARDWRVTSFSALASQAPDSHEPAAALPVGTASEDAGTPGETGAVASNLYPTGDNYIIAAFPRGTRAGHFFHELLEHLDFPAAHGPYIEHMIRQQCLRHDIAESWVDVVANGVQNVLETPLDDGLLLRDLTVDRRVNECEFYYPLSRLDARDLERVVPGLAGRDTNTARFTFSPVSGLMHGYIDLVFEHRGRWFVADWKTNWLGNTPDHYGSEALQQAMRHHAYDLQYWVYTVALHRHLQQKLGDAYDYDQHVGGVYYFFLRGMWPANGMKTGVFFDKPSRAQVDALDALLRRDFPRGGRA